MFKKAIPLVLMSGFVLTACANNGTVPKNNETPMEKVEDRTRDLTPKVNNGQTGPNMDGLDNNRDMNGNGVRNGVIKDNNTTPNGVIIEGNTTTPNGEIINDGNTTTPNEVIIDENLNKNNNRNNH
ncbi:hypothetical protein [Sporosarcina sp. YIM B06819]|uniref:hypothetical protein n=1 Tax=Sporosarcina sp. YIM B06819 TaxID=3081769 RepID=UPI00298BE273|nr:hypothetical protein [Sporosarcina sp. YIM B06819]